VPEYGHEIWHVGFPKYHIRILLGDLNAKVGREDLFKPTFGMKVYTKLVMIMELD
jgi:hypothetical protein